MLRAVIYARFSSDMQREESIEAQVRACREHCRRNQYIVTHIYKDEAKSGKTILGREGYNQMLVDAMEHKFDVIVFHKIDRNARNEFNYYSFKNTLVQLGIKYEYAVQNIDNSPEGQMMENMLVGMAAYYSRNLAKETKKGLNENAYKAMFNGGIPPLGYRVENKRYVIDEHEAEAVRLIFSMYLSGNGYGAIASALASKGFTTKSGQPFCKNSLFDILSNEKYIGVYTFNKIPRNGVKPRNTHSKTPAPDYIRIEDALPAIIEKETFFAVQEKKAFNRSRSAAYLAIETYLLSRKIFCGCCGSAMVGRRNKHKDKVYIYYCCSRKERTPGASCTQKQIRRDILENWVLQILEQEISGTIETDRFIDMMIEHYRKLNSGSQEKIAALKAEKTVNEKKLNNLYLIAENGDFDEYDMEHMQKIKNRLSEIKKSLAAFQENEKLPELKKEDVTKILQLFYQKAFKERDINAKKMLIDLLVKRVSINGSVITLEITTERVFSRMVPRTGIEPVRLSLTEGF